MVPFVSILSINSCIFVPGFMSSIYTSPFSSATSYSFEITTLGTTTTLNPFKAPPFTSKLTVSLLATSVSTFRFVLS